MNRIDRLNAILTHLQSKKVVTASEIADRFEISLRTVYRDIRALEEGGVPVGAEAGRGYFLMPGYYLPPVMFTKEEAASLMTGMKLIEKMSDQSTGSNFSSAMYKIKAVLSSSEKEYLENLNSAVEVFHRPVKMKNEENDVSLTVIQNATIEKKVLRIKYFTSYRSQETEREVEPIGLCYYSSNWHLIAYCHMREDYRDFRVDRIRSLKITDAMFTGSERKSLKEYLRQLSYETDFTKIIVRFSPEVVRNISEQKYYWGYVNEENCGDYVEMSFINQHLIAFAKWMLMFGKSVEIIEPRELRGKIEELVKELQEFYSAGNQ